MGKKEKKKKVKDSCADCANIGTDKCEVDETEQDEHHKCLNYVPL